MKLSKKQIWFQSDFMTPTIRKYIRRHCLWHYNYDANFESILGSSKFRPNLKSIQIETLI